MDETAVAVRGGRHYLYRAVDRHGKSVASLLCSDRTMEAAQAFFRMAVGQNGVPWPEKINVDGNSATHRGLRLLAIEDHRWQNVEVRARRYLNNVVEQDHRAVKQRCAPMLGLKSFRSAAITLLKSWGVKRVKYVGLIAAPEGIARLQADHPDVPIHVGAVDERLNEVGYIVPGLGDAGDRQFGTA